MNQLSAPSSSSTAIADVADSTFGNAMTDERPAHVTSVKTAQSMAELMENTGADDAGQTIENTTSPRLKPFSFDLRGNSLNPIIDASAALMSLGMRFSTMREPTGLERLHTRLLHEIESIELELHRLGYDRVTILAHRYCLCSFIDETIMSRAKDAVSGWSQKSLLSLFHNETFGGEKFFIILDRMLMEPNRYLHLLEFQYLCLCLGYKGKHEAQHQKRADLEAIIKETHDVIRKTKGAPDHLALLYGDNIVERAHHVVWRTPVTMVLAMTAVAAVAIYAGFFWYLDRHVDRTLIELSKILGG